MDSQLGNVSSLIRLKAVRWRAIVCQYFELDAQFERLMFRELNDLGSQFLGSFPCCTGGAR
jgi:hypothetical protein